MATATYEALLDRARSLLPATPKRSERFTVPTPEMMYDGKVTVVRNMKDIGDQLRREPEHILNFLAKEFGCPGVMDGPRGALKSKISQDQMATKIREYTDRFVICSECHRPDTHLDKAGRVPMLVCEACGAQRPVHVRRVAVAEKPKGPVIVGEIYKLPIEDISRRGDGVARKEGFVIFVTGARQKGVTVKVKITKVVGNTGFGTLEP
ncbi:MAG: translation initiation factor IF-2 subunit beta [Euryarchaeota archaeon]|nr:translation initiation factor IF-2 subunit beta [Euryarchaeota archaeon]MDE1837473.1 translation initiation factor IF-2 subunit beta [Euryarchaeota archaeon]MDE1881783.1 translation initiation factor IF-2 subunit beta [Euryarchaeota archaeon]MDE2045561.1 translation initiation factor IF-2 subunit beta [Thermoplasmata archaeon]